MNNMTDEMRDTILEHGLPDGVCLYFVKSGCSACRPVSKAIEYKEKQGLLGDKFFTIGPKDTALRRKFKLRVNPTIVLGSEKYESFKCLDALKIYFS